MLNLITCHVEFFPNATILKSSLLADDGIDEV
jgi:hypothetical protein